VRTRVDRHPRRKSLETGLVTSSDVDAADQIRRQALTLLAVAQNGLAFADDDSSEGARASGRLITLKM
jgi:hypothetical protein